MGKWNITIQGEGVHHNRGLAADANRMAQSFVEELKAAGHTIEDATFTHGAREDLEEPVHESYLGPVGSRGR